jgi:hypothetical protein
MKYMLLIYGDEVAHANLPQEALQQEMNDYWAFNTALQQASVPVISSEALHMTNKATTVRIRDGKTLTTDGPFAETREQLGGFYLIDCKDLDEAIQWASKIPGVKTGSIEIRPVVVFEQ